MKIIKNRVIVENKGEPIFTRADNEVIKAFSLSYQKMSVDPLLENRSRRVANLALKACEILKLPEKILVSLAAYMTDIGMITWPTELITKYPLEAADWGFIKSHTFASLNIANEIWPDMPCLLNAVIRGHHERPGGKGYPDGIFEPSTEMLLVAACDVFDAMTNERPYRNTKPMSVRDALLEISKFTPAGLVAAIASVYIENVA